MSDSGIYGYGVIDGQGEQPVLVGLQTIPSWWSLLTVARDCKKPTSESADTSDSGKSCQQASPILISGGTDDASAKNLTLYKITLRNLPFHTARLAGTHIVVWDVKVQAPWNVPNSDGFDVHGHDILIKNSIVANGDQDVALTSAETITHDVVIDGLRAYGKGGIALLDDGPGFSDIAIHDFAMTGALPSVVGTPFVTGELYAGLGVDQTGYNANLKSAVVRPSTLVTLYAMVQPTMSQTSQYMPGIYGSDPGLFAIGSPTLKGWVAFYDHGQLIGDASISGNGTIAKLSIAHITAGHHYFSAVYTDPKDARFYNQFNFGAVSIDARN